jgi:hypothetical protein
MQAIKLSLRGEIKKTFFCGCVPMEVLLSETVTV